MTTATPPMNPGTSFSAPQPDDMQGPGLGTRFRQTSGLYGQMGGAPDLGSRLIRQARRGNMQFGDDGSASASGPNGFSAGVAGQGADFLRAIQDRFAAKRAARGMGG